MGEDIKLYYKIKPAARLIHAIGSDLIGDSYAALVELVKNSYDADAQSVEVIFTYKQINHKPALSIIVKDNGHGMSFETFINKWLVPATDDKLKRKSSPGGRSLQGRKGIGRFATSILGQETVISTIAKGVKTTAFIDWRVFNTDDYLENIQLLVEKESSSEPAGTFIEIIAKDEKIIEEVEGETIEKLDYKLSYWNKNNIDNLENELRKLISPFQEYSHDLFKINLSFQNCPYTEYNNKGFIIEAFPIINLYDYKISGTIDNKGQGTLFYENNVDEIKQKEEIKINYKLEKGGSFCGNVQIDFRVFDREPEAIENLINKGLIDPVSQRYILKREAKKLLDEVYGINIYRKAFRIRPYGNGGIDWLDLDKDRIQDFTLRVSNNQVVGFVTIEPEEKSDLQEKSARDGLKENLAYFGLKEICKKVLRELELRRLTYRKSTLKSRKGRPSVQKTLDSLFSFTNLKLEIERMLKSFKINHDSINKVTAILDKEEESKVLLLEEIQKTIAIYQGQATLGKIVSFILHEGRKPLHFFRNEAPVLKRSLIIYRTTKEEDLFQEMNTTLEGFVKHSNSLSELFKKINPLASQTRGKKSDFNVRNCILDAIQLFNQPLRESNIIPNLECDKDIILYGWQNDLYIALTNLIENSIYWLNISDTPLKTIEINVNSNQDSLTLIYQDSGPGLTKDEIKTEVIFEPGYSKKIDGTGLGLSIAGEAIERLNGNLLAHDSDSGAYFQIEINKK